MQTFCFLLRNLDGFIKPLPLRNFISFDLVYGCVDSVAGRFKLNLIENST